LQAAVMHVTARTDAAVRDEGSQAHVHTSIGMKHGSGSGRSVVCVAVNHGGNTKDASQGAFNKPAHATTQCPPPHGPDLLEECKPVLGDQRVDNALQALDCSLRRPLGNTCLDIHYSSMDATQHVYKDMRSPMVHACCAVNAHLIANDMTA
jgi:hypothetical protein